MSFRLPKVMMMRGSAFLFAVVMAVGSSGCLGSAPGSSVGPVSLAQAACGDDCDDGDPCSIDIPELADAGTCACRHVCQEPSELDPFHLSDQTIGQCTPQLRTQSAVCAADAADKQQNFSPWH